MDAGKIINAERDTLIRDEGLRLFPYNCTAGKRTIGIGRNLQGNPLAADECMYLLASRPHVPANNTPLNRIRELLFDDFVRNGITYEEAIYLFENDCRTCIKQLDGEFIWYKHQPFEVQRIMLNMTFNMGIGTLKTFVMTLPLIASGRYKDAAERLRMSKWYRQVTNRAERLCKRLETQNV